MSRRYCPTTNKVAHATRERAEAQMAEDVGRWGGRFPKWKRRSGLYVFQCVFCSEWHVATRNTTAGRRK